jgi:alpha-L-fucosidase 2
MNAFHLSELNAPIKQWIGRISETGRQSAHDLYGCGGLVINGCCDYSHIGRTDNVGYFFTGAAAWLAQILWQHWEYERDIAFLADFLYPFMCEIAAFYEDFLEENAQGYLLPPFGASPEFQIINNNTATFAFSASSIDIELIYFIFTHISAAQNELGITEHRKLYEAIIAKLPLPPIREDKTLSEFFDTDYIAADKGHRHRSLLVGLCPGDRILYENCPETAEAAYRAILQRQEYGKASSQAFAYTWDTQLLARLGKGKEAYEQLYKYTDIHILDNLLSTGNDWDGSHGGLTWFKGQKVFQIEACISAGAGILEMIFSDRGGTMWFLPALPGQLSSGKAVSLAARGGFDVSFNWKDSRIKRIDIYSRLGSECRMRIPDGFAGADVLHGCEIIKSITDSKLNLLIFSTQHNKTYTLYPGNDFK